MRFRGLRTFVPMVIAAVAILAPALSGAEEKSETFGIANATLFPWSWLIVAGQPTGEQLQLLAEGGYRTVIDLRTPAEPRGFDEPEAARRSGLVYVNVPVTVATLDQATIDRFFDAVRQVKKPATLIHCSDANRVAALLYAWQVLERGIPPEEALEQARFAGLREPELTAKVRKLVAERAVAKAH
jgi:protein tyrosine phosphatase (PTP) superfamily phosphohydrolase (DUF442 family)